MPADGVYDHARDYDIAFGFRDVARECGELLAIAGEHGMAPRSFLELACGPGRHAVEMAGRGLAAAALDLSPAMLARTAERARRAGVEVRRFEADIRNFTLDDDRFDLAALLMDSVSHLLTNQDLVEHLGAVARHLRPGGIYVLEMGHPANHFGSRRTTRTDWTMVEDGVEVATAWGQPTDPFDPIAEVDQVTVTMTVAEPGAGRRQTWTEVMPIRRFTHQTLQALLAQVGELEAVAWLGAIDRAVPFDDSPRAWRMVPVLRRR